MSDNRLAITDLLYAGAIVVFTDFQSGILIVWNGSETFRVIRIDEDGRGEDVDVFTRYDERLDAGESLQSTVHAARLIASAWWKGQQEVEVAAVNAAQKRALAAAEEVLESIASDAVWTLKDVEMALAAIREAKAQKRRKA